MKYTPYIRIALRYGVGAVIGLSYGTELASDPELVSAIAVGVGAIVEAFYEFAKRKGWAT